MTILMAKVRRRGPLTILHILSVHFKYFTNVVFYPEAECGPVLLEVRVGTSSFDPRSSFPRWREIKIYFRRAPTGRDTV